MRDTSIKSHDNKKILYINATNLYGNSMSQVLLYDESEMRHGHPELFTRKLEEILNTPDDRDIGYFIEVDL